MVAAMLLALLTCLGALLGSLRQDAGEDALPPSARFGLAWEKGAALEPETLVTLGTQHGALAVPEVAALVSNDTFFERHVQVLGLWGEEAQSAAAQAGLEYVLVLERARGKSSKPVSREYADPQGRTARLRRCDGQGTRRVAAARRHL